MGSLGPENCHPHAVCVPFAAQGHINPMLKLAKILHQKGFHITFVNTEYNHKRLLKSRGSEFLNALPSFRFETIPDGLPPSEDIDSTQDMPSLCYSILHNCLAPFRGLLAKLSSSSEVPPVTCIIADVVMSFSIEAARDLGVPVVLLWTSSVCSLMCFFQYEVLVEKGLVPLQDASYLTNGYLDSTVIDWIPGMEDITLKNFPSFVRTTDPDDFMVKFAIGEVNKLKYVSAVIFNTFDDLDSTFLKHLSLILPNSIFTLGPLQLLLRDQSDNLNSIKTNLWKEQPGCTEWLDSKEPNSVVYVNFGSITVLTPQQLVEFAWGLANSKKPFLWVIRPDLVIGESAIVPSEFLEETIERSLLASWCPQEEVLKHPSIGGFLTHNGWNSTLESICGGVPMICWPFFGDQQTNSWSCSNKLGIGMEIDSDVKRSEIGKLVKELMDGEKGKAMKKRAMEWKKKAEEAASPGGSSDLNLEKMINAVLIRTPSGKSN